jgi:hypothetical protein
MVSHSWHRLNSPGDAIEKHRRRITTFITVGTYVVATGEAATGHAIPFLSPIMSAFFHSKNALSILYRYQATTLAS